MILMSETTMVERLPAILKSDPDAVARASAISDELTLLRADLSRLNIEENIDYWPSEVIEHLAWEKHVSADAEGWKLATTDQAKQDLIRDALLIHSMKGTPAAIKRIIKIVGFEAVLSEWFQYAGDPYEFKIEIISDGLALGDEAVENFLTIVNEYKNVRSFLLLDLTIKSNGNRYYGAALHSIETVTIEAGDVI